MGRSAMHDFVAGDRVRYDDTPGEVVERIPSEREVSDDYDVRWPNGRVSRVWGSDLLHEEQSGL